MDRKAFLKALVTTPLAFAAGAAWGRDPQLWAGATPPLALYDLEGRLHRLDDYRGRVVLLHFWATWCEPCREEIPGLERLRQSFAGARFVILAVNVAEPPSRIRAFLQSVNPGFAVLRDDSLAATKAWRARILPTSVLVDSDGRIRHFYAGELDWSLERQRRLVADLLPR